MPDQPDTTYSFNPWMRPEERLGDTDETIPPLALNEERLLLELYAASPIPPPAPELPRFGYPVGEMTIDEVLEVGPAPVMRDDWDGFAGSLRNAMGE